MIARHHEPTSYEILEFSTKNWKCDARDALKLSRRGVATVEIVSSIADSEGARCPNRGYKSSKKTWPPERFVAPTLQNGEDLS